MPPHAPHSIPQVDPAKYAGVWHEAARKPTFFQRKCSRSQAEYQLLPDGRLSVKNRCFRKDGTESSITGSATPLDPPLNARYEVRFDPFLTRLMPRSREGNYWIYDLAPDYSWAIVGTKHKDFLWILTRAETPTASVVNELLAKAQALGFDISDVIRAPAP